ncbi:hypothetical protein [Dyella japonica]|uniref:Uncharacterized protein n=1 Tax=Dyella japonica TaxID=231455 RepID=A0ABV2JYZ2_9GAMM
MSRTPQNKPCAVKDGLTFWPIPATSRAEAAFGLDESAYFDRRALPDVPRELEHTVQKLFFEGGRMPQLANGVDREAASLRLRAMLASFAPSHESKVATAAYALWVWSTPEIVQVAA